MHVHVPGLPGHTPLCQNPNYSPRPHPIYNLQITHLSFFRHPCAIASHLDSSHDSDVLSDSNSKILPGRVSISGFQMSLPAPAMGTLFPFLLKAAQQSDHSYLLSNHGHLKRDRDRYWYIVLQHYKPPRYQIFYMNGVCTF